MRIASAVADESMPPLINTTLFPVVMGNHISVHDVSGPAAVLAHAAGRTTPWTCLTALRISCSFIVSLWEGPLVSGTRVLIHNPAR